ncbi:hypothetical protein DCAR_0933482 [Daucus carota subsp. sativus]|uniref:PB1-like domain-containing protein n=1 Tax=Daucus carota subsp. sativus TaxID=79200 RepID=A0AAF0XTE7_DAUCS|nr:hypothetical protein DCAR_0933482 [Daucus carota subsp. sativus]
MSSLMNIEVNHHGKFPPQPLCYYIGGKCDLIPNVDTDLLSFRDLDDWAIQFGYNSESLVYFKTNGHDFSNGVRVLYDDGSIRDMVGVCSQYGKIEVYVDSSLTDEELAGEGGAEGDGEGGAEGGDEGSAGDEDLAEILRQYEEEFGSGEDSDPDDPAYKYESEEETDELYSGGSDVDDASDEEFAVNKENYKSVKEGMKECNYSEDDFDSDELRSIGSSSEDENRKIGYNPTWKVKEMIETIRQEMEIDIPWIKAMRLRKAALEGVHDSLKQHYSRVWDFGQELLKINPHNTVKISGTRVNETDENRFQRMYVCYSALKKGWKAGCRPVIGLDGCFLKTVCGGQLLSAVGRDGNNQMYPICHAVVEVESTDSCKPAYEQLLKLDPAVWTKAHISTIPKADNIENNMSECFNSWIINERYMNL